MKLAAYFLGDYQFDVYRMMRELTRGVWEDYQPITNILVSYLLLLTCCIEAEFENYSGYITFSLSFCIQRVSNLHGRQKSQRHLSHHLMLKLLLPRRTAMIVLWTWRTG